MECGVGWRARGRTALKQHGRSERCRPVVPRGVLTGAWPPHGSRVLAQSERGRVTRDERERGSRGSGRGRSGGAGLDAAVGRKRGAGPTS